MTIVGQDLSVVLESWHEKARCKGWDPEIFYPDRGVPSASAKAVCRECPVQPDCLDYAISRDERFGIWGGLSERERRKMYRERQRSNIRARAHFA